MRLPTTLTLAAAACLSLAACHSSKNDDSEIADVPLLTDPNPLAKDTGESERFVIRDKQQRLRVDGRVDSGRMTGTWLYYDSKGEKLALVTYRADQRTGPAELFYVTADGPAVKRQRMNGAYVAGTQNGMFTSNWPSGGKKLERDFDQGILQGARGWSEKGERLSDGAAMTAAIAESKAEEDLLTELENFVQLQLRKQAAAKAESGGHSGRSGHSSETSVDVPNIDSRATAPYPGGTAPLTPAP